MSLIGEDETMSGAVHRLEPLANFVLIAWHEVQVVFVVFVVP